MNENKEEREEWLSGLAEPERSMVASLFDFSTCNKEHVRLLTDGTIPLPLRLYLYSCVMDGYPMNVLKELSGCRSFRKLSQVKQKYAPVREAANALDGILSDFLDEARKKTEALTASIACPAPQADAAAGKNPLTEINKKLDQLLSMPSENQAVFSKPSAGSTGDLAASSEGGEAKGNEKYEGDPLRKDALPQKSKDGGENAEGIDSPDGTGPPASETDPAWQEDRSQAATFLLSCIKARRFTKDELMILQKAFDAGFTFPECRQLSEASSAERMQGMFEDIAYERKLTEKIEAAVRKRDCRMKEREKKADPC